MRFKENYNSTGNGEYYLSRKELKETLIKGAKKPRQYPDGYKLNDVLRNNKRKSKDKRENASSVSSLNYDLFNY
jgi:hypothetical protein